MGKIRWPLRVRVASTNVVTGYRLPILSLKYPRLSIDPFGGFPSLLGYNFVTFDHFPFQILVW